MNGDELNGDPLTSNPTDTDPLTLEQAWRKLLPAVRWFAGKARTIATVRVEARAWISSPPAWPAVREENIVVGYADGDAEEYFTITSYRPCAEAEPTAPVVHLPGLPPVALSDATTQPDALTVYLDSLGLDPAVQRSRPVPLAAEQSNTSVRIGPDALFKLYRRPVPGPNREELLLSRLGNSQVTPTLYLAKHSEQGRLECIVTNFIDARADGWTLATQACLDQVDFTQSAADLGAALRQLHHDLRHPSVPYPTGVITEQTIPGAALAATLLERLERSLVEVAALAPLAPGLRSAFSVIAEEPLTVQQIHADFHLGQCLDRCDDTGWVIIDFEGEPMATPTQRLAPDSPWRDVAGALRSFAYAAATVSEPPAGSWVRQCQHAFLDGYRHGDPVPAALLLAYQLDKAVYEARYESQNRPEWATIPLEFIHYELIGSHGQVES